MFEKMQGSVKTLIKYSFFKLTREKLYTFLSHLTNVEKKAK